MITHTVEAEDINSITLNKINFHEVSGYVLPEDIPGKAQLKILQPRPSEQIMCIIELYIYNRIEQ